MNNIYIPTRVWNGLDKKTQDNLEKVTLETTFNHNVGRYDNNEYNRFNIIKVEDKDLSMLKNLEIIFNDYLLNQLNKEELHTLRKLKSNIDNIKEMLK